MYEELKEQEVEFWPFDVGKAYRLVLMALLGIALGATAFKAYTGVVLDIIHLEAASLNWMLTFLQDIRLVDRRICCS